ncbi:MAG: multi-sensor signal transduction histidine [Geobacteraceae bacterium]|nr:MAG: multi-sensor signal transduction histidine [Geobacteraceae bacterium]
MKPRLSIRSKLILSILPILLVSYSTLLFTTIKSVEKFVEEEVIKELAEHLNYAHSQYLERSEVIKYSLMQPASAIPVQMRLQKKDKEWLKDALQRWRNTLPFADVLTIVDPQKNVVARVNNDLSGDLFELGDVVDRAFRGKKPMVSTELVPYPLLNREGKTDLGIPHRKNGGALMVTVVIPVVAPDGVLIGGVIAGDILNRDTHLPYQINRIFGSETELTISQSGFSIASSLKEELSGAAPLDPKIMTRLQKGLPYWGEARIGEKNYKTVFEPIVNSRGECIGSLSVALSMEGYRKIRRESDRNILTSAFIGILLSFGIAYLTAGKLTKPLKSLARGVERIEQGDLNQQVAVHTTDEFGMLADSFNRMASALAERDRTITKKTRDLEELNELLENRVAERTVELRMEMGRLEAILTSMVEGIVVTDSDNRVILFNPAAQKIFDLVPHRVLHKPIEQVCELGSFCILSDCIGNVRSEKELYKGGEEELSVKGKKLKASISPLLDGAGNFAGVVMSIRDVTVEEEVDRMKTEFISTVSHELKTPLTSMKGSLQYIMNKGKWLTGTERELLSVCLRNTERLIRLINDILDISKIEAGRLEFSFKPQSIGELAVYSIEEIKSFAMSRNISIVNCIGDDIPFVYGDHDRLIQVLTNLLSNAVKFSPAGKVVMVSAKREGNYVAVSVADHGKVIQWADRGKLFKKFQQLASAETGVRGGTGLGLAICKEIVERHHGRIFYETEVTGGNVFTFTVPVYEEQR